MSAIEFLASISWYHIVAWFVVGYVFWVISTMIITKQLSLGDLVVGLFACTLGPGGIIFLLVALATRTEEIIIWRKKY